jgi:HAD superfamily hydrolase (TIGR01509 family)
VTAHHHDADDLRQRLRKRALAGVLLDVDGTLLDSNDAHAQAWVTACHDFGYQVSFQQVRPLIGKGGDKLLSELLGLDADAPPGQRLSTRRRDVFVRDALPSLKPTRGARALLQFLANAGLRLVVATSATGDELEALLRQAGVHDLIEHTATSSDADESKPDPHIVQAALAKAHLHAAQVLMLGDTPYDIQAASTAGVDTVALRCGGWWDDASLRDAVCIFDNPADFMRALA